MRKHYAPAPKGMQQPKPSGESGSRFGNNMSADYKRNIRGASYGGQDKTTRRIRKPSY